MSQYYVICNVDKQELLHPSTFEDGLKLMEFGSSSLGTLQAFALLASQSNGRGRGDVCRTVYESQAREFEPKPWERVEHEWETDVDHRHKTLPDGQKHLARIIVPAVSGRWCGDRVVIAGDYGDDGDFLSVEERLLGSYARLKADFKYDLDRYWTKYGRTFTPAEWLENPHPADCNLYRYACMYYSDVSEMVKTQLAEYGEGASADYNLHEVMMDLLSRRLTSEYGYMKEVVRGRKLTRRWSLHWLTMEMLDSFLRRWADPGALNRAKAWLRKQVLEPWQQEAVKCYQGWKNGEEKINRTKLEEIRARYGIKKDPEYPNRWWFPPVLPKAKLLEAAIAVQCAGEEKEYRPITVDDVDGADMERVARAAGISLRHRVIDLDGSGA